MRIATVGICSNESGIDSRRMFMWPPRQNVRAEIYSLITKRYSKQPKCAVKVKQQFHQSCIRSNGTEAFPCPRTSVETRHAASCSRMQSLAFRKGRRGMPRLYRHIFRVWVFNRFLHTIPRLLLTNEDVVLRGLGLALDGDGCHGMVWRLLRQVIKLELIRILLEVDFLIRGIHARRSGFGHQAAHLD